MGPSTDRWGTSLIMSRKEGVVPAIWTILLLQLTAAWKLLLFPPCSVWSVHQDLTWKEFNWWQRSLHTQHHQPCVWTVNVFRADYTDYHYICAPQTCLLFCSGCLRWPVSCPRRKTWRSPSMTMISWLAMKRSARPSLIWRTASCLDTTPTVVYHRRTACRQTCLWVLAGHLIEIFTQAGYIFFFLIFNFLVILALVSTSGGTS